MQALYQATVSENLGHEAALMSRALALDLIGADDFARRAGRGRAAAGLQSVRDRPEM
jgi:hypothetical protein